MTQVVKITKEYCRNKVIREIMEKESKVNKQTVLLLKLNLEILKSEKMKLVRDQQYKEAEIFKEKQLKIEEELSNLKEILINQFQSLDRSIENYQELQSIKNLLLEFIDEDQDFRIEFQNEINNRYNELEKNWKELQQKGEFSKAKLVYTQRIELGKFLGKIPK